jgi:hypothetical protein
MAALGLLIALLTMLWLDVAVPILDQFDERAELRGISLRALKRDRALLRQEPAIQAALAAIEQSPRWRNFYEAEKPEAAELQLETDLREILRPSNNPTSMAAESAVSFGSATRIGVRVTLSMRVDQLADALDRIQKQSRQLRVESLTIQAPDYQGENTNPTLSIQAQISALMVTSAGKRT